jgi:hypothetical protein
MGSRDDRSSRMGTGTRNDDPAYARERERAPQRGHESPYGGYGARRDEGGFLRESAPGHVPGQRWSGGYGGDRDREGNAGPPDRDHVGRGFTGNDFGTGGGGGGPRHFGNVVDRGGRMGLGGGESTTGRGYWGWDSDRAGGVNIGPMGGREGWNREHMRGVGYGFEGTDMGMGAPEEQRGPHYGKGPKGYKRSDERTHEEVCDAIAFQGHIDASDVEVKVESGIVTLSGTVARRDEKRALEHLVERCRGVHEVHNELRLKRERPADAQETRAPQTQSSPQSSSQNMQGQSGQPQGLANGNQKNKNARA